MSNYQTVIVPNDAELFAIAQMAQASHLHLITNGKTSALSPTIPAGWKRLNVLTKATAGDSSLRKSHAEK